MKTLSTYILFAITLLLPLLTIDAIFRFSRSDEVNQHSYDTGKLDGQLEIIEKFSRKKLVALPSDWGRDRVVSNCVFVQIINWEPPAMIAADGTTTVLDTIFLTGLGNLGVQMGGKLDAGTIFKFSHPKK